MTQTHAKQDNDWLESRRYELLAQYACRPVEDVRAVHVTERMIEAAIEYLMGLYDNDWNAVVLEDVYRIMESLSPREAGRGARIGILLPAT